MSADAVGGRSADTEGRRRAAARLGALGCGVVGCVECVELPPRLLADSPYRVRVSGPQVGANKRDEQDRPVCWVFDGTGERLCHEVTFHGPTRLRRGFSDDTRCPTTGAIIWLETWDYVTLHYAANREQVVHNAALVAELREAGEPAALALADRLAGQEARL